MRNRTDDEMAGEVEELRALLAEVERERDELRGVADERGAELARLGPLLDFYRRISPDTLQVPELNGTAEKPEESPGVRRRVAGYHAIYVKPPNAKGEVRYEVRWHDESGRERFKIAGTDIADAVELREVLAAEGKITGLVVA